jgi:DinB family protein
MSTKTAETTAVTAILGRVLAEGYGPGAWHGADLKAALADVTEATAFKRPADGRHSIAEIAIHHAYCTRSVRERLSGKTPEPFILEGDDWFALPDTSKLTWKQLAKAVETEQRKLADVISGIAEGKASPLPGDEQLNLVLGITCHAVYHAGQVQLLKKLV